jgi:hypothetical protein
MGTNLPRFVVLRHEMPSHHDRGDHFDFMLECDGQLLTWALDNWPIGNPPQSALQLPAHRIAYLDYEGPVFGDRGHVSRVDAGYFESETPVTEEGRVFQLRGGKHDGRYRLQRQCTAEEPQRWTLEKLS